MRTNKLSWCAERRPFQRVIVLYARLVQNGLPMQASPLQFTAEPEPGLAMDPLVTMTDAEAQDLMDQLWSAGLRPTEGSGSAGSLAATERHLADMRRLVLDPPSHLKGGQA